MARPRKPTAVLEMTGAFRRNPDRKKARESEPKTAGPIGPPPAHLSEPSSFGTKLVEIWNELAAQAPEGVLTVSDREQFATLVKVTAEIRRPGAVKPALIAAQQKLLSLFAMNPVARAQHGAGAKDVDDLDAFLGRKRKTG